MRSSFSSCPNLCEQLRAQPDHKLFTDGNSFQKEETRYASYTVVTLDSVLKSQALAPDGSAQKAELIVLTCTLQLGGKRNVHIYTDSKCAFTTAHVHGAIYILKRRMITSRRKDKHLLVVLFTYSEWVEAFPT
jgi:ribonuclease HI